MIIKILLRNKKIKLKETNNDNNEMRRSSYTIHNPHIILNINQQ